MSKKKKRKLRKKTIFLILAILLATCSVVCIVCLIREQSLLKEQEEYYNDLKAVTIPVASLEIEEPEEESVAEPEEEKVDLSLYNIPEDKQPDFAALKEINEDIYAWVYIPGTEIDYPIVQHPEELDYYLTHNLDGSEGYPGGIYTQYINSKEFDDFNTVVYGHNMRNGSMFKDLHKYEDDVFFEENPYIYVYTETGVLVYQIFAAYEFSDIHLIMGFDLSSEEVRRIYLNNVFTAEGKTNNYNMDIAVTTEDNILTMATCIGNKPDKRYLVSAVLVADGRE